MSEIQSLKQHQAKREKDHQEELDRLNKAHHEELQRRENDSENADKSAKDEAYKKEAEYRDSL